MPTVRISRRTVTVYDSNPTHPDHTVGFLFRRPAVTVTTYEQRPDPTLPLTAPTPDCASVLTDSMALHDPARDAHYYCTNTVDPGFDLDGSAEFDECPEIYAMGDLTIVEPTNDITLRRWLRGYDVL